MSARIDVIVPTILGREESLEQAVTSLKQRDDVNVIVVPDSKTCGWGWQQGLAALRAPYILYATDDQQYPDPRWADVCIETVEEGTIPCPRVWYPDGRFESQGGDMNALHHIVARPQKDWTEVGYTTIPFLSAEMAERIGMLPVHYCSDVWVSHRGRQLGYPTVLRHGYDVVHHWAQVGRGAGMTQIERDAHDWKIVQAELEKCVSPVPA